MSVYKALHPQVSIVSGLRYLPSHPEILTQGSQVPYKLFMDTITPLRAERLNRNLTTYEVAAAIGIHRSHYARIETCKMGASPAVAKKIEAYFDGKVTRLQILYPEDYLRPAARAASQSQRASKAA